jgi:PEP-CTERM motif
MMKKIAASMLVVGLANSFAFGGTIGFDPSASSVERGDTIVLTLSVADSGALAGFDSMDVIVGSDTLTMTGFAWDPSPGFVRFFGDIDDSGSGVYSSDIKFGYFGTGQSTGLIIGTLTVDIPMDAPFGDNFIEVDNSRENPAISQLTNAGVGDTLFGSTTINVVPEPATLALLGIGGLATALRRRRRSNA